MAKRNLHQKIAYFRLPITIEPCEEGGYFAKCKQLQGCFAEGDTLPEVWENIQNVAELVIESMIEWGDPIPKSLIHFEDEVEPIRVAAPVQVACEV